MKFSPLFLSLATAAVVALPAVAQTVTPTSTTSTREINVACVQTAVEKREGAIIAAFDKRNTSVRAALVKRQSDLKAAWGLTVRKDRNTAIHAARETYRKSWKDASATLRTERHAAWRAFNADRKACGGTAQTSDVGTQGLDNQL